MHLDWRTSKYKGKVYKSYGIAESYREDGKVKKKRLFALGKLTDEQAAKIRLILNVISHPDEQVTTLANIVAQESVSYLDVAVVNQLWETWQLSDAFTFEVTKGLLRTDLVAKILVINRCLEPCSHYSVPRWIKTTALPEILGEKLLELNDDKIYYELSKIQQNQPAIENFLFKKTYEHDPQSYDYVNYDLSSSYFVGLKCKLSAYGRSKDGKANCKQVVLALMVNSQGYPFKWDVFAGNMPEINTMEKIIKTCAHRFKLQDISMVFDRGLVAEDILSLIDERGLKYISALDHDQIPNVPNIDLNIFKDLDSKTALKSIPHLTGFTKYDSDLYFKDLGITGQKRYIVGINPVRFLQDRKCRQEKIDCFQRFVTSNNRLLKKAKRDRQKQPTLNKVTNELKRLKISKYYETAQLKEISVSLTLKDGSRKQVKSFQVTVKKKPAKIATAKLTDGLCVFVTNHIDIDGGNYRKPAERIIQAYREKTQIEDAFKNIKSFVKIRPFFVNKEEHVKSVYTICVLSYFINRYLSQKRKASEGKDFLNSNQLYEPLKSCKLVKLLDQLSGITKKDIIPVSAEQKEILAGIVSEKMLKFSPIYSS
jgi:transposase